MISCPKYESFKVMLFGSYEYDPEADKWWLRGIYEDYECADCGNEWTDDFTGSEPNEG